MLNNELIKLAAARVFKAELEKTAIAPLIPMLLAGAGLSTGSIASRMGAMALAGRLGDPARYTQVPQFGGTPKEIARAQNSIRYANSPQWGEQIGNKGATQPSLPSLLALVNRIQDKGPPDNHQLPSLL